MKDNTFFIILYVFFVLIYFSCMYKHLVDKVNPNPPGTKWSLAGHISLFFIIIISIITNLNMVSDCGLKSTDKVKVWAVSILPWPLILGSLAIMLQLVPRLKAPFAETFGYLVVSTPDTIEIVSNLLANNSQCDPKNFLTINEFSIDNFLDLSGKKFSSSSQTGSRRADLKKFWNLVVTRDLISQGMWWLFTGLVIIMYQSSYLTSMKCVKHGDVPDHKDDAVSADSNSGEDGGSEKKTVYNVH